MPSSPTLRRLVLSCGLAAGALVMAQGASAQQRNCLDTLASMQDYSRLVNAVTMSHMGNDVRNMQNVTIFAPTNAAIQAVNPQIADRIFPRDQSGARQADPVLASAAIQAHVVQGRVPAAALAQGVTLRTQAGNALTFSGASGSERAVTISGGDGVQAKVVQADIPCANGVIHGIDHVLLR